MMKGAPFGLGFVVVVVVVVVEEHGNGYIKVSPNII
jgi:hypothetical protein